MSISQTESYQNKILERLSWKEVMEDVSSKAQCPETQTTIKNLKPFLKGSSQIKLFWDQREPLKNYLFSGKRLPLKTLPIPNFSLLKENHILETKQILIFKILVQETENLWQWLKDHPHLLHGWENWKSLKTLSQQMDCLDIQGNFLDGSTQKLWDIRNQIRHKRRLLEGTCFELLSSSPWKEYAREASPTLRQDRWVLPMKPDSHKRVPGRVLDFSKSHDTWFIEPHVLIPWNDQWNDLKHEEHLEILSILKTLSQNLYLWRQELQKRYKDYLSWDFYQAQILWAMGMEANSIFLGEQGLDLKKAFHPVLKQRLGTKLVKQHLFLDKSILIVSGPNAGGKTTILKTLGLMHSLLHCGFFLPCQEGHWGVFGRLWLLLGDQQDLNSNLSSFSGHLLELKVILEEAQRGDLILLDELAAGTQRQTASALSQAILEELHDRGCWVVVTTHDDILKSLPHGTEGFYKSASLGFHPETYESEYELVYNLTGVSLGLELAQRMGFPDQVLKRAKSLAKNSKNYHDDLLTQLSKEQMTYEKLREETANVQREAKLAEVRFQKELELLKLWRKEAKSKVLNLYKQKIQKLEEEFRNIKSLSRSMDKTSSLEEIQLMKNSLRQAQSTWREEQKSYEEEEEQYTPLTPETSHVGMKVKVVSLQRKGIISSIRPQHAIVSMGSLSLTILWKDLCSL